MRLEIMLSQRELLKEGDLGKYVKSNKSHNALAKNLHETLDYLDHHLEGMTRAQLADYLEKMYALDSSLSQFSSSALSNDVNSINETNQNIQKLYRIYSGLSVLLIILSAILGVLNVCQNRKILKLTDRLPAWQMNSRNRRKYSSNRIKNWRMTFTMTR